MAWKKNKDGGIDYDVKLDLRRKKNEKKIEDDYISCTATTVFYNEIFDEAKFDEHNIYNGKTILG